MKRTVQTRALFIKLNGRTFEGDNVESEPVLVSNFKQQLSEWILKHNVYLCEVYRLQNSQFIHTDTVGWKEDRLMWHNIATHSEYDITPGKPDIWQGVTLVP